ncbi:hypothetical protein [Neolewinella agarilytica]|uniref:hypothetical protein n=1 Tax=Neolewinella agarilytica TaxID=478744 RepID=UPI002353981B|nr:hypothetical protein [Neolewinella agarilytica]
MLSLFRSNQAQAGLFLLVYALLLQLPALLGGAVAPPEVTGNGFLGNWLMNMVTGNYWLGLSIPVLLIFVQGIQANLLASRHRFSRVVTQFPGLFVVLIWAMVPSFRWVHPGQVANVFLLFGLIAICRLYKKNEPSVPLFNAGAWLGLAFLFRPEYLFFAPAFLTAIVVLRRPEIRSFFQWLTGFVSICFFAGVAAYFFGSLPELWLAQVSGFGWFSPTSLWLYDALPLGLIAVILLPLSLLFGSLSRLLNIEGKKGVKIIYWFLLFTIPAVLLGGQFVAAELAIITVPIGILLGLAMVDVDSSRAEVVHLLLFAVAIAAGLTSWIG